MKFSPMRLACTAGVIAAMMAGTALTPSMAQDAPAAVMPETVVATVDGSPITEADLGFAAEDLAQELQQMPPEQRKPFLVRVLIDMKVMAKAGEAAGMADTPCSSSACNICRTVRCAAPISPRPLPRA
ncbi:hypothetical protein PSC71_03345 [Devosia sp. J2-20]|uniref:hypothetical protein n=1 Tax=Devosia sp. J2-20 TaxID=3026161 RepID=UPI00249A919F|nr:hypothetical protein [Devosia sp. J2-20]WDQ99843.1 hypothetical protein PSC71_03345 [Devosia sp. J2-20]